MIDKIFKSSILILFLAVGVACLIQMPQPQEAPPAPGEPAPAPEEEEAPVLEAPQPGILPLPVPKRFTLNFQGAYLVYEPQSGTLQITAEGNVLSYGGDWEVRKVKSYLYHIRQETWQGLYWQVNTSRKETSKIKGGTFGSVLGGTTTDLPFNVDVVGGAGNAEIKRFIIRFPKSHMVYTPDGDVLKLITENNVLSTCGDWRRCKLHTNLYHFKQKKWDNFFWKVNTGSKKAWRCRNGVICEKRPGGSEELLNVEVGVTR